MDYQAGAGSSKVATIVVCTKKIIWVTVFTSVTSFCWVLAQTTTNPLTTDVTITAAVLEGIGTRPNTPPSPPGTINPVIVDVAVFKGLAYPGSIVSVFKNSIVLSQLPVNGDGSFEMHIRSLPAGTYTFGVRAEDKNHLISKLLTFTIYISGGIVTTVDGIFIPPTITSNNIEVKKGEPITFFGSSFPNADVRLSFLSEREVLKQTTANASGTWQYILDSSAFDFGDYEVKARSILPADFSFYSDSISFRVGSSTRKRSQPSSLSGFRKRCDLNDDGRVNLIDFSIMAFWYKRLGFPVRVDLNTDNKISLTDLSILAYCWTG